MDSTLAAGLIEADTRCTGTLVHTTLAGESSIDSTLAAALIEADTRCTGTLNLK